MMYSDKSNNDCRFTVERFLEIAFLLKLSRKNSVQFYRLISKLHASPENEGVTFRNDSAKRKEW